MNVDQENNNTKKSASYQRKRYYRDLLNRIEGLEESDDIGINAVKELGEIFKEVNLIDDQCAFVERVEFADETLLQSVVLSSASGFLVKCIENLDIFTSTYEPTDFATKLLNELKESEQEEFKSTDWLQLLDDAYKIVPDLPNFSFLYGSFDPTKIPEPKERKERSQREAQDKVEKKQLERVHNAEKDEAGIDDTVNFLANVLSNEYENNNRQPVSYFEFVVDSTSFSWTVENVFYTSFLVRDGTARLDVGDDGCPKLQPMRKRDLKGFRSEGGINAQVITSITMEDWNVLRQREGYIEKHKRLLRSKS